MSSRYGGGSKQTDAMGPRGETLVAWAPKPDNRKYLEASVTAYRGNTTVWIGATNTDRKTPVGHTHEPTRPSPVMTADQVAELALSSDLLLYP